MRQGAESRLYKCIFLGKKAAMKERFEKKYRHTLLNEKLTKERLKAELRGIQKCQQVFLIFRSSSVLFLAWN